MLEKVQIGHCLSQVPAIPLVIAGFAKHMSGCSQEAPVNLKASHTLAEPLSQLPTEMKRLAVDDAAIERFGQRCESISNQLGALTHG